jgi:hypothetical protein
MSGGALLEWSIADRRLPGESCSGDRAVVVAQPDEAVVAAVDGLGHGPEAARAADAAIATVVASRGESVPALVARCHEALRDTRGAALSVAQFDRAAATMTWVGIGNVEGRLVRAIREATPASLILLSGIVGDELPPLRPVTLPVGRGDVLVFATDGVDALFSDALRATGRCADLAHRILADHAKTSDDALVVVARYLGDGA